MTDSTRDWSRRVSESLTILNIPERQRRALCSSCSRTYWVQQQTPASPYIELVPHLATTHRCTRWLQLSFNFRLTGSMISFGAFRMHTACNTKVVVTRLKCTCNTYNGTMTRRKVHLEYLRSCLHMTSAVDCHQGPILHQKNILPPLHHISTSTRLVYTNLATERLMAYLTQTLKIFYSFTVYQLCPTLCSLGM